MDGCRMIEKVRLNNQSIYKFGLSVCLFVCSYLPTGYQDIFAYNARLPGPLRLSGPAVRTKNSRVIRTKNWLSGPFSFMSAQKMQSKPTHLQALAKMFLYLFDYTLKLNVTYNDSNIKISFIKLIRITIDWMMMIIKIIRMIIIDIVCFL